MKTQQRICVYEKWSSFTTWKMTQCRFLSPSRTTLVFLRHDTHCVLHPSRRCSLATDVMLIPCTMDKSNEMVQGTILKRHKVYITDPRTGGKALATPDALEIGTCLNVYGEDLQQWARLL